MAEAKKVALVTGASSGLGAEFCRQLGQRCDTVIAIARRAGLLRSLAEELADVVEVHCLEADLRTVEGVARSLEAIRQKGPVHYLVNNAGFGAMGDFGASSIDAQRAMVDLHIDATISLCRAAIPFMREQGGGAIINVSSLGSLVVGKGIAVYGATKAFLNYFSEALQAELAETGIEVQALCPGFTRTGFHDAMHADDFDPGGIPEALWMTAEDVVAESLAALGSGRVIVVPGAQNQQIARAGMQEKLGQL